MGTGQERQPSTSQVNDEKPAVVVIVSRFRRIFPVFSFSYSIIYVDM
jgi:hypothetical protein